MGSLEKFVGTPGQRQEKGTGDSYRLLLLTRGWPPR
jgi:hypothetical protein